MQLSFIKFRQYSNNWVWEQDSTEVLFWDGLIKKMFTILSSFIDIKIFIIVLKIYEIGFPHETF